MKQAYLVTNTAVAVMKPTKSVPTCTLHNAVSNKQEAENYSALNLVTSNHI